MQLCQEVFSAVVVIHYAQMSRDRKQGHSFSYLIPRARHQAHHQEIKEMGESEMAAV